MTPNVSRISCRFFGASRSCEEMKSAVSPGSSICFSWFIWSSCIPLPVFLIHSKKFLMSRRRYASALRGSSVYSSASSTSAEMQVSFISACTTCTRETPSTRMRTRPPGSWSIWFTFTTVPYSYRFERSMSSFFQSFCITQDVRQQRIHHGQCRH